MLDFLAKLLMITVLLALAFRRGRYDTRSRSA